MRCDWRFRLIYSMKLSPTNFNSSEVRLKVTPIGGKTILVELFQFQWGAIEGLRTRAAQISTVRFQFQWGAIEGSAQPDGSGAGNHFNSSEVRLKDRYYAEKKKYNNNFNSSEVRLKVPLPTRSKRTAPRFQFQWGAIEGTLTAILQ